MAEVATETRRPTSPALAVKRIAIVPAFNEEESVQAVIDEIRAFDPDFEVVVVDDGSTDGTAAAAAGLGAHVVRLPFNLGIGGAVQTGFRYAFEHDFQLAVRVDGDGQHDPSQLGALLGPLLADEADIVVGSRFASRRGLPVVALAPARDHDPGEDAVDDRAPAGHRPDLRIPGPEPAAIALFAADYPHDYPEVEAALMVHKHGCAWPRCRCRCASAPPAARRSARSPRSTTWSR